MTPIMRSILVQCYRRGFGRSTSPRTCTAREFSSLPSDKKESKLFRVTYDSIVRGAILVGAYYTVSYITGDDDRLVEKLEKEDGKGVDEV